MTGRDRTTPNTTAEAHPLAGSELDIIDGPYQGRKFLLEGWSDNIPPDLPRCCRAVATLRAEGRSLYGRLENGMRIFMYESELGWPPHGR